MTVAVGGLRTRLIFDNLYYLVKNNLTQIGWLNSNNNRRHLPIHFVVETQDLTTEVPQNTLALSDENVTGIPWEIGSQLTEDTRWYFFDLFAESDPVAKHLMGDVMDILRGKFASLGRTAPVLPVYDLRNGNNMTTPPPADLLFTCDIVDVRLNRAHGFREQWLAHWYSIQMRLLDYYNNDFDAGPVQ